MKICKSRAFASTFEFGSTDVDGCTMTVMGVHPFDPTAVESFVNGMSPENLISITGHGDGVIVWYWDEGVSLSAISTETSNIPSISHT